MRFSIITVCKNNLEGLRKTFNSIKSQTFNNFEWIVIDGDSNDGTIDFLIEIKIENFIFISEPDKGLYDAMNKGIDIARGNYMIFINGGDLLYAEDTLQILSDKIDKFDKAALVYGDSFDVSASGKKYYRKARNYKKISRGMFTQHQSMCFLRFEKKTQPLFSLKYKLSSDYQFIINYLKLEKQGYKIINLKIPISCFELGGLNEIRRFQAIKEDFMIRKKDLELNFIINYFLYYAHFFHTLLKAFIPKIMMKIRY